MIAIDLINEIESVREKKVKLSKFIYLQLQMK